MGRLRRLDVRDRVATLLVCGANSRPRNLARSRQESLGSVCLRLPGDGLARLSPPLAPLPHGLLLLAGLATPLVVSVHTIVSFDFTIAILPGWHSTIFPPFFVAGAIFSGFAMVITLAIPLRGAFGLQDFITSRHLDNMAKVMLATGMIVAYGYMMESFSAWYGNNGFEKFVMLKNRPTGPYAHTYWMMMTCNVFIPQLLWSARVGDSVKLLWAISIVVNIGMWLERYVIVITSLHRDDLPSSWSMYHGTVWDYATFYGTLGLFLSLIFLFIRFLPVISITEMRELVYESQAEHGHRGEPKLGEEAKP